MGCIARRFGAFVTLAALATLAACEDRTCKDALAACQISDQHQVQALAAHELEISNLKREGADLKAKAARGDDLNLQLQALRKENEELKAAPARECAKAAAEPKAHASKPTPKASANKKKAHRKSSHRRPKHA